MAIHVFETEEIDKLTPEVKAKYGLDTPGKPSSLYSLTPLHLE
jgi:hypothetical protein